MSFFKRIKVFISYSHSDKDHVSAISQFLPQQAFDVYFDRSRLHPGWTWEPLLLRMIEDADVLVLLVGADTMTRDYVNKEVEAFLARPIHGPRRGLIPVLIDGCESIPSGLGEFQALDLRGADAQSRARTIGQAIHGAHFVPTAEVRTPERGLARAPEPGVGERLKEKWEAGQIGVDPSALAQMVNMRIVTTHLQCAHREADLATMEPKQCPAQAIVVCMACVMGACEESFHVYGRFCTVIPPEGMFEAGTKLFYWCPSCRGPVCVRCLGIEDDYPCPANRVLSHRFACPVCARNIQVVPVLQVDMRGVALEFLRWARAGGPPDVSNT